MQSADAYIGFLGDMTVKVMQSATSLRYENRVSAYREGLFHQRVKVSLMITYELRALLTKSTVVPYYWFGSSVNDNRKALFYQEF